MNPQSWPERLLTAAISVLASVALLSWAWTLFQPLLPVVVIGFALVLLGRVLLNRWRY